MRVKQNALTEKVRPAVIENLDMYVSRTALDRQCQEFLFAFGGPSHHSLTPSCAAWCVGLPYRSR